MKFTLLALLLLSAPLLAQIPQPLQPSLPRSPRQVQLAQLGQETSNTLPENYQLTLTFTDKDNQPLELSIVVASPRFTASLAEQGLTFIGMLAVEEAGITLQYNLGWQTMIQYNNNLQPGSSTMEASVRLKLGEEVQLLRFGPRSARLTIKKLEAAKPK